MKNLKKIFVALILLIIFAFAPSDNKIRIFMIGDSTMAEIGYTSQDYQGYPRGGWGMGFQPFFNKDEVEIKNYALAGRRTDTYYKESKGWGTVLPQLRPGDVLFIQFGHNETSNAYGSYKDYLEKFCDEAIAKGAQPVLLTPINRCSFRDGEMYNTLKEYPDATRQLAAERGDVPLIDLHLRTKIRFEELGEEYTKWNIYSNIKPGIYPTWPNGRTDGTHLLLEGAWEISNMVRESIIEQQDIPIFQKLRPSLNRAGIVWVLPEPNMSGTFSTWGTCIFPEGTQIEIVPTATGSKPFSAWKKDGVVVSTAPTYRYTVSHTKFELTGYFGDKQYDCNGDLGGSAIIDECGECVGGNTGKTPCEPKIYTLTTTVNGQGEISPPSGQFREGTVVSLAATGELGWAFGHWSGDASGTANPLSFTMDANKSITANFFQVPTYTLTSSVTGQGSISPNSGTYSEGDMVSITATPGAGWRFESWGGDASGTANPLSLTMDANKTITATFVESPVPPALISLGFNDNSGSSVANTGMVSATFNKADPPSWSANVPVNGGTSSVDFGTSTGNYYVESSASISELAGMESFTVTGWVNNRNSTTGSGGNRILSWINNGGNGVDIVYNSNGSLTVGINEWPDRSNAISSTGKIPTDASAPASNWRFFAVTYESSSGNLSFYFGNNTLAASLDKTITYNQGAVGTNIGKLAIGHFNAESSRTSRTNRMFRGLIDQVDIFGSVLSLAEIQAAQNIGMVATYNLNIAVIGQGSINPSSGTYPEGEKVCFTTTPASGWVFSHYEGSILESDGCVTMDGDKSITAVFTEASVKTYTLTTDVIGNGAVSGEGTYMEGAVVSVTATADEGWVFDSWSGDATGSSNPVSIAMDNNKSVTAIFKEQTGPVAITLQENEEGFCSVDGSVDNNNAGFTGTGFANTNNEKGKGITWSVSVPSSGIYVLVWRIANGSSVNRTAEILVNGSVAVSNVDFPSTGSWTSWTTLPGVNVTLPAGTSLIRLQATNSSGLANIDYVEISGIAPTPVACVGLKGSTSFAVLPENGSEVNLNIYPNPASHTLSFEFNKELDEAVTIYLIDMTGKPVQTVQTTEMDYYLDMSGLPNGLYIVKVSGKDHNKVMHISKF